MRRWRSVCGLGLAFLLLAACGGTDGSAPLSSLPDSTATSPSSVEEPGTGSDVECAAPAVMEVLERSSWFTADSVDVVSEPGERLPLAVIDGVSWTAGQPTFEDGETVVVSMTPDGIDTALDVGATFATTGPVPIVVQAFHVSEDRVVVIDPTCSTAQSVLDGAQAELGVSGTEMLELLMSENGRATILAASG